jgi:DNA-binding NtrC family response regulator
METGEWGSGESRRDRQSEADPMTGTSSEDRFRILIVDDDLHVRLSLSQWLEEDGYTVGSAQDAPAALQLFHESLWDVVLLDLRIPGGDGLQLLKQIKSTAPQTVVFMMTGYATIDSSVAAMKEGAYDYIVKPVDPEKLSASLRAVLTRRRQVDRAPEDSPPPGTPVRFHNIIGKSPPMQRIFELIRRVADTNATVLITGETGTGKELVARALHSQSLRRFGPFVAVSCSAIPENLLESELFGYEKGAFTGAERLKQGRFEQADGGTLFLDEVGEIPQGTQVKLLRVLQERAFQRLGGTETVSVDVRLVAATNRNLWREVDLGRFRSDLLYRLNVVHLHLPPLRERLEDVPLLAAAFMKRFSDEYGRDFQRISPAALERMRAYPWPGNVRELENTVARAVALHAGPTLEEWHLPFGDRQRERPAQEPDPEPLSLREVERRHILKMLERHDWNISRTARVLEIDRTTLHKKIKKYGLKPPDRP